MEITELINHPERLDRDTLYELRSVIALYPYFQTARLLMLKNLYLLHDPSFDEELRKAAIYITDRKVIFQLVEAAHYKLPAAAHKHNKPTAPKNNSAEKNTSRTISLIDNFLDSIPQEEQKEEKKKRRPTPADAAVDYVAYLLETDSEEKPSDNGKVPLLKGQNLIDSFIENDKGKIVLSDTPQFVPQIEDSEEKEEKGGDESYFTETLARIYIKQGRYSKALEIIRRLSLNYPKKKCLLCRPNTFLRKIDNK